MRMKILFFAAVACAAMMGFNAVHAAESVQSSSIGSTLSMPHPYGVQFSAGIFDMQITNVDLNAWPEVEAENRFNRPTG